jgi:hypothetical protein
VYFFFFLFFFIFINAGIAFIYMSLLLTILRTLQICSCLTPRIKSLGGTGISSKIVLSYCMA